MLFPLTLAAARAADDAAVAAAGPVVELPKFVVTDSRELPPPESWRYATMPGFEILSNASDKATQRLLRDFNFSTMHEVLKNMGMFEGVKAVQPGLAISAA